MRRVQKNLKRHKTLSSESKKSRPAAFLASKCGLSKGEGETLKNRPLMTSHSETKLFIPLATSNFYDYALTDFKIHIKVYFDFYMPSRPYQRTFVAPCRGLLLSETDDQVIKVGPTKPQSFN